MSYHKDKKMNQKITELLDALCSYERDSGNGSVFILVPINLNEEVVMAEDGKPLTSPSPQQLLRLAYSRRGAP